MPSFLPPDLSTFVIENGQAIVQLFGQSMKDPNGWGLINRATVVLIDGPGDEGFLIARLGPEDRAPAGWDECVDRHGGAWLTLDRGEPVWIATRD